MRILTKPKPKKIQAPKTQNEDQNAQPIKPEVVESTKCGT